MKNKFLFFKNNLVWGLRVELSWQGACLAFMKRWVPSPELLKSGVIVHPPSLIKCILGYLINQWPGT